MCCWILVCCDILYYYISYWYYRNPLSHSIQWFLFDFEWWEWGPFCELGQHGLERCWNCWWWQCSCSASAIWMFYELCDIYVYTLWLDVNIFSNLHVNMINTPASPYDYVDLWSIHITSTSILTFLYFATWLLHFSYFPIWKWFHQILWIWECIQPSLAHSASTFYCKSRIFGLFTLVIHWLGTFGRHCCSHSWIVFSGPVLRTRKKPEFNRTTTDCNWTTSCGCPNSGLKKPVAVALYFKNTTAWNQSFKYI